MNSNLKKSLLLSVTIILLFLPTACLLSHDSSSPRIESLKEGMSLEKVCEILGRDFSLSTLPPVIGREDYVLEWSKPSSSICVAFRVNETHQLVSKQMSQNNLYLSPSPFLLALSRHSFSRLRQGMTLDDVCGILGYEYTLSATPPGLGGEEYSLEWVNGLSKITVGFRVAKAEQLASTRVLRHRPSVPSLLKVATSGLWRDF